MKKNRKQSGSSHRNKTIEHTETTITVLYLMLSSAYFSTQTGVCICLLNLMCLVLFHITNYNITSSL